ncbi:MAG TPA: phospho-N-acetylmuramoyl-pentapeptide-transferase [Bacteroidia bacterium]|nr:phospho-N-acetylmuramoyl-pentapeptide-transferase [Bacteroidota bacterium]MBP9789824.1 phospho-N-acetylmuramoyl-pentapeptide-transferase [Bacteroidia bacterium]MBK7431666.1 phospho-N-acetylmuramoyl-pentapeptide-transferase [Bacteroidota bacterium]MBK7570759.1 phospho-N-acetylmuramoyl-pentapeptide-transferase [Bacteroidota bacterium]MBK8587225.1 phospho-N-acetylmuramoyl-pentapeptide-transferase [Bacteroidota bacterium]
MLYYLFAYLHDELKFPGAGVFQYISFRAALALITSLVISLLFGKKIIGILLKKQVGETVRDLGLEGQKVKQGTPTMGGLIIIAAILIPTLLFARLINVYVIIMIVTTVWLGIIGFIDDYIKVFKKDKAGLAGKFKILGQVGLGLIIGITLYWNPNVVVKEKLVKDSIVVERSNENVIEDMRQSENALYSPKAVKSTKTTIPFIKNHELDYSFLISWMGGNYQKYTWLIFIPIVILIITAVSNGANITDGIDGLATGTSAIIGATLGILAYVSGNTVFANYLNIMYIPHAGELVVFIAAFVGACVGFLWYNAYPAQVFMGDTGSLALGGIIATYAIAIRKELLIPILCGVFLIENVSVVLQVGYFKYTKKKYGEGRRIFKMSPLHHHYQKLGYHESKIVSRFWIIGITLAVLTVVTLKLR